MVEAGAGKCSLVCDVEEDISFESSIIRVRPDNKKVNPLYLYYFFKSPIGRGRISAIVSGTNVKGIRSSDLARISIRVPDNYEDQNRLCSVISAYDKLIANNERRIVLLEQLARELYEEWFVRFRYPGYMNDTLLDGVPSGWTKKKLGEVAKTNRESYSARNLPDEINYIEISSVSNGRIHSFTRVNSANAPGRARRIARDGDVIWSNVRPNLRQYALILSPEPEDVFSTGFTILSATSVPSSFLYVATTTEPFVGHLVNFTTGSSYPAVRPEDFENAEILVPLDRLLLQFGELCEPVFRQCKILSDQIAKLIQARDLILPRLIDGRIAV